MLALDRRFLTTLLLANFVAAPMVALVLTLPLKEPAVWVATIIVLVCPCVDYVIPFTKLAGGNSAKLLATIPFLLLIQLLFVEFVVSGVAKMRFGEEGLDFSLSYGTFLHAFLLFIVLPLGAAAIVQRTRLASRTERVTTGAMVPLLMAVLLLIVAVHADAVAGRISNLLGAAAVFAVFAAVMPVVGYGIAAAQKRKPQDRVAVSFSATTRNSLVMMPIVLALPQGFEIAPIVVVTQTMVELVALTVLAKFWQNRNRLQSV